MKLTPVLLVTCVLGAVMLEARPQDESENENEPAFQLPVQLIGFPVIIMAVRFSNFLKKLTYTLNPRTYVARTKRAALDGQLLRDHVEGGRYEGEVDVAHVEHQLVAELGPDVCLFEDICQKYAAKAGHHSAEDWENVVRKYEAMAGNRKKFYLLSVFMGDIVSSPKLCHQIAMRPGRACNN